MTDLLDRARAVAGELPDCEARDVVLALMREVEGKRPSHPAHFASGSGSGAAVKGVE